VSRGKAATLAPPGMRGWDFGDFPYGLEPLTLPPPGTGWLPDAAQELDLRNCYLSLLSADLRTDPVKADDLERLFWFRWITGHHVSFLLWRLLAGALAGLAAADPDGAATTGRIIEYVRAYSAMLLYTGSSTRKIYNETIRPSMFRLHNTFSGTWSADYRAVRGLFRGRQLPTGISYGADALQREVRLSNRVHADVAARLVADGRSLLQRQLEENPAAPAPRAWTSVFDCYFLTVRASATGRDLLSQLLRRCKAVLMDLATNGLYPAVADYEEFVPDQLRAPDIESCERELADIVLRAVGLATGCLEPAGAPESSAEAVS
jgi:L-tyrosine peroxygenase